MHAWLNLRYTLPERKAAFTAGLRSLGYTVTEGVTQRPGPEDILVTWNRIHVGNGAAAAFEAAERPVLVAENATWGNDLAGRRWYTLARNRHNTAGMFPVGGPERWDALGVELAPWRQGGETVVLGQRGIGAPPTRCPPGWGEQEAAKLGARLRPHPGTKPAKPLQDDLARAGRVVTWGSGAAVKALIWGIPVESHMPGWIAEQDNTDAGRLEMFRRLAWAQWTLEEIADGEAFRWLLSSPA
jgi:hypothetical protein